MKTKMMFVGMVVVMAMAFMGCQPTVTPPAPKLVSLGTYNVVRVADASTVSIEIWEWDNNPGTYFEADGTTSVSFDYKATDFFVMMVAGEQYLNATYITDGATNYFLDQPGTSKHRINADLSMEASALSPVSWSSAGTFDSQFNGTSKVTYGDFLGNGSPFWAYESGAVAFTWHP